MKLPISALRRVLLTTMVVSLLSAGAAFAQSMKVTGKVTDAKTGESIPGVNVLVKGTTTGMATDMDGKFSLTAAKGSVVTFSFIGYAPLEVTVTSNVLNVQLSPMTEKIDEVVVIGYGTVKKNDATGSVQAVGTKDFNRGSLTSPQQLLQGKSAGVVITQTGGAPGGQGSQIRIRGGSSLNASNDPLIVVDGVPLTSESVSGQANPLNSINPDDIETFTILKDASATAIYGSRASNGIIMITTKKGSSATKMQLTYNGNFNINTVGKTLDVYNAADYKALATSLAGNLSGLPTSALSLLGNANTNWQDEIFRTSYGQSHNISAGGKVGMLPYRISYGYTNDDGILKNTSYSRNSIAGSFTPSFLDNSLKVTVNARGNFSKYNYGNQGAVGNALAFDPTQVISNGSPYGGYFTWVNAQTLLPNTISSSNPVAMVNQTDNRAKVNSFIGNAQFDYKFPFLPELRANLNLALDYTESHGHNNSPDDAAFVWRNGVGNYNNYSGIANNKLLEFYLNYNKTFGVHNFDVTGGYSWQHFWNKKYNYQAQNDPSSGNRIVSQDLTNKWESFLVSYFGRINYSLMDRYKLTFTLRDDGSSKFASKNHWGLYPAAALAWNINKEEFLKGFSKLSDLKLRLGYGVTGQQNLVGQDPIKQNYGYIPSWTIGNSTSAYYLGGQFIKTYRPEAYNTDLKWEETTTYNAAIDFGFFNNRISGSVDFYTRKTKNLLSYVQIPVGSNLSNYLYTNVGDMENKGVELTINARPVQTKDWNWNFSFNTAYNENEITKLSATNDPNAYITVGGISGGVGNTIQINKVGYPANSFFVYQQVYHSNGMPIEGLYVDRSGQGGSIVGNLNNKYIYKHPSPDVTMGLTNSVSYKNWDLFFALRVYLNNYVYNNIASANANYANLYNQSGYFNNLPTSVGKTKFKTQQLFSDYYIENGSFLRMDNLSLGYNFNKLISNKVAGRLSFTVQNVFVITNYTGLDPEVAGGIDGGIYPKPRIYTLGLTLNLK